VHPSGIAWPLARHGRNETTAVASPHPQGSRHHAEENHAMMPHLPPDEAVVAALVLVGIGLAVIWLIEYWK